MHKLSRYFLFLVQKLLKWKKSTKALVVIMYFFVILSTAIDNCKGIVKLMRVKHTKPANKVNRTAALARGIYQVIFVGAFLLLFVIKQKKIGRIMSKTLNFKRSVNNKNPSLVDYIHRHIIAFVNFMNFLAVLWSVSDYFLHEWNDYKFYRYHKELLRFSVAFSSQLLATIYYSIIVIVTEYVEGLTLDVKAFMTTRAWLSFPSGMQEGTQVWPSGEILPPWKKSVPFKTEWNGAHQPTLLYCNAEETIATPDLNVQCLECTRITIDENFTKEGPSEDLDCVTAEVRRLQRFQQRFNSFFAYPVSAILIINMFTVVTMIFKISLSWRYRDATSEIIDVLFSCSLLVIFTCAPEFLLTARAELQSSVLDLRFLVRKAAASARRPRAFGRVTAAVDELGCLLERLPEFNMRNLFTIGRGTLVQMWSFIATYVVILLQFQTTFEDDVDVRKLWKLNRRKC